MALRRARARLRVPGDHRPLGQPRLRQRRLAGAAAPADRARARGRRADRRDPSCWRAARSTSCPTARSTTTTSCSRELDWVIASVHTAFAIGEQAMTERMIAAIEHPLVRRDRPPHRAADRAPRALRDRPRCGLRRGRAHAARCSRSTPTPTAATSPTSTRARPRRAGVLLVIDSDAHRTATLANMRWGVATARRAWLSAANVANTRSWSELQQLLQQARQ